MTSPHTTAPTSDCESKLVARVRRVGTGKPNIATRDADALTSGSKHGYVLNVHRGSVLFLNMKAIFLIGLSMLLEWRELISDFIVGGLEMISLY